MIPLFGTRGIVVGSPGFISSTWIDFGLLLFLGLGNGYIASVLVTMQRRRLRLSHLVAALPDPAEEIALPPFTVSELLVGIHRAPVGPNKQRMEAFLEALLEAIPVLPFGVREARAYGLLWAQLLSQGQVIGAVDALIGATALAQGYGVLTENLEHFRRIPGLAVTAPTWA